MIGFVVVEQQQRVLEDVVEVVQVRIVVVIVHLGASDWIRTISQPPRISISLLAVESETTSRGRAFGRHH